MLNAPEFKDRLLGYKRHHRLTLADIGELAGGATAQAVAKWLKGGDISEEKLRALADNTGLPLAWWRYGQSGDTFGAPPANALIPPRFSLDELALLQMYQAMPEHVRAAWTKIGATLMEAMAPPSSANPYGKAPPGLRKRPKKNAPA